MEDEKKLLEEQSRKRSGSINICVYDFEEDESIFLDNFSTPKGRFANTHSKAKNSVVIISFLTNLISQNIKKELVKDTFPLHTPRLIKIVRCLQQLIISVVNSQSKIRLTSSQMVVVSPF